ncbi:MAG: bifunctional diguanylate cyclase/phosphodiesterase, partial [Acidimicrobiia bacterium]|nr:bifunctional diguanylate cyclase/phosphodiesterase [Acidimicrobiia bacterium]
MSGPALELVPEPDPDDADNLLLLRARMATEIASGRRSDAILDDLAETLSHGVRSASATIVSIDRSDSARVRSSDAPTSVQRLMHGSHRRRWFGSWGAAITRMTDIVVPELAGSSLYREHQATFVSEGLLAARAEPIIGQHGLVAGAIVLYLQDQRLLTEAELALLQEVTSLVQLTVRRDQARGELLDRIRYDALTGLENRDGLEDHLRSALAASRGTDWAIGLLFVDIDDLTLVNDSLGHTAGDTVIATTADRIQRQLLPGDVVVRFGGDEFIVVLERIDGLDEAQRVAERIREKIGEIIRVDGTDLTTTVCIGITEGRSSTPPLQLIDEGHAAVVRAKQNGRGSTTIHDRSLDTGAGDRLGREVRLREALENDEFCVYWQPKVGLTTGRIVGAEALVRWDHPERGTIGPDEFIGTAERAGLMSELSDWILNHAVSEAKAFTKL